MRGEEIAAECGKDPAEQPGCFLLRLRNVLGSAREETDRPANTAGQKLYGTEGVRLKADTTNRGGPPEGGHYEQRVRGGLS
jgi:hypothetical protein